MNAICQRLRLVAYSIWNLLIDQIERPARATQWLRRKAILTLILLTLTASSLGIRYAVYAGAVARDGHFYMHADLNAPCPPSMKKTKDAFAFISQSVDNHPNSAVLVNAFSITCGSDAQGARYALKVPHRFELASQQKAFSAWVHDLSGASQDLTWTPSMHAYISWNGFLKFYCQAPRDRTDGILSFESPCDSYAPRLFIHLIYGLFILLCLAFTMAILIIAALLAIDFLWTRAKSLARTIGDYLGQPENLSRAESRSLNKHTPPEVRSEGPRPKRL